MIPDKQGGHTGCAVWSGIASPYGLDNEILIFTEQVMFEKKWETQLQLHKSFTIESGERFTFWIVNDIF